jgi:hypothetical protein
MSRLFYFGLGVLVGAGAVAYGPELSRNARPLLKEAMKAAVQLGHGARVKGTGLMEMLEDAYAEVLAELQAAPAPRARRRRPKARKHAVKRRAKPVEAAALAPHA